MRFVGIRQIITHIRLKDFTSSLILKSVKIQGAKANLGLDSSEKIKAYLNLLKLRKEKRQKNEKLLFI